MKKLVSLSLLTKRIRTLKSRYSSLGAELTPSVCFSICESLPRRRLSSLGLECFSLAVVLTQGLNFLVIQENLTLKWGKSNTGGNLWEKTVLEFYAVSKGP